MGFAENIDSTFETMDKDNLSAIRESALSSFKALGIPSARHEEWKYTHIKTKLPERLKLAASVESQVNSNTLIRSLVRNWFLLMGTSLLKVL
jgi:hypothetical protein